MVVSVAAIAAIGHMSLEQNAPAVQAARRRLPALASRDLALALAERAAVLALFALFVHRLLPQLAGLVLIERVHPELLWQAADINAQVLLLVIAEGLGVALILARRRSATLSAHPLDWGLAFGAVSLPLLLTTPAPAATLVPANRGVKTRGPYRLLRHPMYAGYTLTHIGFLIGFPSLANTLLYAAVLALNVARILREEAILTHDAGYRAYATRVRFRLLPGLF